jgi:hypothetical protein
LRQSSAFDETTNDARRHELSVERADGDTVRVEWS